MAKKRVTNRQEEEPLDAQHPAPMDEAPSEKLESLKTLNAMLLKETVEKRQLVDSLQKAKLSLQSELTRADSDKSNLTAELTRLGDTAARLELERSVAASFLWVQMGQQMKAMEEERDGLRRERDDVQERVKGLEREIRFVVKEKGEIEKVMSEKECEFEALKQKLNDLDAKIDAERSISTRVRRERDEFVSKLDVQITETNRLREILAEMEKREEKVGNEAEKLRVQYNVLFKENEEKEKRLKSVMSDKESMERSLFECNTLIDELNGKIEATLREKRGIEEEKNVEMKKRCELEEAVDLLNEKVLSLQKVEEKLQENAAELEKKCVEGMEKRNEMERNINELVEGKNESESRIAVLVEEKSVIESKLEDAIKKIEEKQQCVERMVIEKREMEEAKTRGETEILKLQNQVTELKDTISRLEECCRVEKEKIMRLEDEVGHSKCALESVALERDEARKGLDEEKQNGWMMKKKIASELAKSKADYDKKKELEMKCELFNKEILSLRTEVAEAEKAVSVMQTKLEVANAKSEEVEKMLKSTAILVGSKEDTPMLNVEEDIEPHVLELETIKKAIKNRENKVEEMRREVEFLRNSVTQANKRKSFWTIISSATTLFAAMSLAYVARAH